MLTDRTYLVGRDRRRTQRPAGRERRGRARWRTRPYIAIPHETVDLPHAEVIVLAGTIYVRDLGSASGTFLLRNDRKVPFHEGYVAYDEFVFFGHCLRLIGQMVEEHERGGDGGPGAGTGRD